MGVLYVHHHPLHEPKYSGLVEKFKAAGLRLPEARVEFPLDEHGVKTWCYWLGRGVAAKQARVATGQLPEADSLPGTAKRLFYTEADEPDARDRVIAKLVSIVAADLPADKRAELLAELND